LGNLFDNAQTVSQRRALLSNKYRKTVTDIDVTDIDVVIPVPETSRTYAICLAELLGIPYREGFIKNRYIARTSIMSNHQDHNHRSKMVKMKLNTIASEFKDKNVLIVDDSMVRGTTSRELVRLAKEAGAKKIWFASAAPPIRYPNYLGIDIPRQNELIAHNKTEEEIATILGCDRVFYNNLKDICDGLLELASEYGILLDGFEVSCFAEQNIQENNNKTV
jgi:amidophosphoribosyltransferase